MDKLLYINTVPDIRIKEMVSTTGTFIKNSVATWTTTGADGIPSGWTVETANS